VLRSIKNQITRKTTKISKRLLSGTLTAVLAFSPVTPLLVTAKAAAAETGILFPTSRGTYTAWENGVATVDETGTPSCSSSDPIRAGYGEGDDDSDDGDRESVRISLSDIPNNSVITSVTVHVTYQAHESGYTGGTFKTFVRLNDTNFDAATNIVADSTDCTAASQTLDVTDTKKNGSTSLEIGVIKTGTDSPERNKVRVGTLRAVVTYTDNKQKNQIDDWCTAGGVKFDPPVDGTKEGITADFSPNTNEPQTVTITTDGTKVITKVVVKGGSSGGNGGAGNQVYESGPFTDLVAPLNTDSAPADDTYAISHVIVCYDEVTTGNQNGTITITKLVDNDNNPSTDPIPTMGWEFDIDGSPSNPGPVTTDAYGKTPAVEVEPGTYSVTETLQNGYAVASAECLKGQTPVGTWNGNTVTGITVGNGEAISCTFVNRPTTGSLTVQKIVNGGSALPSDFQFVLNDGGNPITFEQDGTNYYILTEGTQFDIKEVNVPSNYEVSYSGQCKGTITASVARTCSITNTYVPGSANLTLVKIVKNDNGGTLDATSWTLTATDPSNKVALSGKGEASGEVQAGIAYTLGETGPSGYTASSWVCEGGNGNELNGNVVTLEPDEDVTCTITNDDDPPVLKLMKKVFNFWGGNSTPDDWELSASGPTPFSGNGFVQSGSNFQAGTYTLTEDGPDGYRASAWYCNGQRLNGNTINIVLGEHITCVIKNYSKPAKITVDKKVINDDGGTAKARDFDLWVGNKKVKSGEQENFRGDTWYKIFETGGPKGYKQVSKECWDVTFGWYNKEKQNMPGGKLYAKVGHKYYCKIVNDDIAPKLTIKKDATPNSIQPFTFTIEKKIWNNWITKETFQLNDNGTPYPLDNDKTFTLKAGTYRITEAETEGWYLKNIKCWGTNGEKIDLDKARVTLTLKVGDKVTCEFKNNKYAKITGFKFEDTNKDGKWNFGEKGLEGWEITLTKKDESEPMATAKTDKNGAFVFENLKPGKYIVCEIQQDGWVQTAPASGCEELWVKAGDREFVKFGNFKLGKVSGVKFNDINGNGVRDQDEPTLKDWEIVLTKKCDDQTQIFVLSDCKEEVLTTKTNENGTYAFTGLDKGTYVICEGAYDTTKWLQTAPNTKDGCVEFAVETSGHEEVVDFGNKAKPQILDAATTDPQELVKTGAAAAVSTGFGLIILSVLGALHFLTRRKES